MSRKFFPHIFGIVLAAASLVFWIWKVIYEFNSYRGGEFAFVSIILIPFVALICIGLSYLVGYLIGLIFTRKINWKLR
jgi:hypothetical protein